MTSYAEFLKANGASEEDVKSLDTPVGRKAYEKMQANLVAAEAARKASEEAAAKIESDNAAWFENELTPTYKKMQQDLVVSKANEAKARAALEAAQKQGLIEISKDMGYDAPATPPANPGTPGFDPAQYFTREDILKIAAGEGDAIALAQDIAAEHSILFPGTRLNFRELRAAATASKKSVEQVWMEKYGVTAAREAKAKADHDAEIAKWKAEGAKEKETELVSKYSNPETRPLSASVSPFTPRPAIGRDKQPWEIGTGNQDSLAADRVKRATLKEVSKAV